MSRKGLNIYKRKDGRWEARYIKSRTAQGKPLYGYLYASSYHEARNRLQDVIRLQGNAPNSKEMSKGSVFEFFSIEWLDTFSTSFKESTYIRYRTLIRCYLMPYFQTAKIESITKEHVLDFCKEIETHGKRDGTALSTKTVSDILSVLRRILHYAKAQNIPVDSAIFDIRIKQTPKPLPVLSLSEQLTLQKYLIGHPDCLNLGILLCLFTGIRIGELCALTWDKISLSERNLCICQTMQRIQTRIPEWNYADENGDVTKMQLTVQAGSRQMNAIVNYPSNLDAEAIAGIIAGYTLKKEYPEIEEAYLEFQKAAEANSRLAERIDVNHVTEAQMQEAEALAAQWEALESKYGSYFQIYENEIQKWAGVDWRPQIIETVFLSNPVSRVEKTSDTLYIYVPTGTRYTKAIMDFISYSGKSESIDATDMVMKGKKNNLSQPIYEWDMSSNMIGSFKIEYREDK